MLKKLKNREGDVQRQKDDRRIREAKFNREYKDLMERDKRANIWTRDVSVEREEGEDIKALVNLRLGNLEENNKYWLDEGVRICVFCDRGRDNLSHYVKECREISNWFEDLGGSAEERINKLRDLSMEDGKRVVVMKL